MNCMISSMFNALFYEYPIKIQCVLFQNSMCFHLADTFIDHLTSVENAGTPDQIVLKIDLKLAFSSDHQFEEVVYVFGIQAARIGRCQAIQCRISNNRDT